MFGSVQISSFWFLRHPGFDFSSNTRYLCLIALTLTCNDTEFRLRILRPVGQSRSLLVRSSKKCISLSEAEFGVSKRHVSYLSRGSPSSKSIGSKGRTRFYTICSNPYSHGIGKPTFTPLSPSTSTLPLSRSNLARLLAAQMQATEKAARQYFVKTPLELLTRALLSPVYQTGS